MTPQHDATPPDAANAFSLVDAGPLFRLLQRLGLADRELEGWGRRGLWVVALAWVPLAVISGVEGRLWDGCEVPLLRDIDAYTRFLLALPMLLAAERLVQMRMRPAFAKFIDRRIVVGADIPRFQAILASTRRWLDAWWPELLILVFVYTLGAGGLWEPAIDTDLSAWYGVRRGGEMEASMAGHWLNLVSVPMFQFFLLRWYYRLLVWWALMWRLSRLDLQLQPLHPDHAGGLGFLSQLSRAFAPLLVAQGILAAGWIADQIFFSDARLLDFKLELAAVVAVTVAAIVAPLLMFSPALADARQRGLGSYGNLSMRYAAEFNRRWLGTGVPATDEPLLGTADIQSLADLGNAYANLKQMRLVVFDRSALTALAIALLLPVTPLVLTMFSVDELMNKLVSILL